MKIGRKQIKNIVKKQLICRLKNPEKTEVPIGRKPEKAGLLKVTPCDFKCKCKKSSENRQKMYQKQTKNIYCKQTESRLEIDFKISENRPKKTENILKIVRIYFYQEFRGNRLKIRLQKDYKNTGKRHK